MRFTMPGFVAFKLRVLIFIGLIMAGTGLLAEKAEAASLPPWPMIYSGSVTVGGAPAPDGAILTAKIGDYTSVGIAIKNGGYAGLAVGGPDSTYLNKTITFHLDDTVVANETDTFLLLAMPELKSPFNLTFPDYPTPTPFPSAPPTNTPIASPPPQIPTAMVLSGVIELDAGEIEALVGKEIVARVGSYFSEPVTIAENYGLLVFDNLVVDPEDYKYLGMEINLIIDGLSAGGNSAVFESGGGKDLALRVSIPEPTPVPVPGEPEPEPEPEVPVVEPTPPAAPPATSIPVPKDTTPPPQPTVAPVVVVVTATPEPTPIPIAAEESEEEGAGGCNAPGMVSPVTGAANALMLFAPLMLVAGYKGYRRRKE